MINNFLGCITTSLLLAQFYLFLSFVRSSMLSSLIFLKELLKNISRMKNRFCSLKIRLHSPLINCTSTPRTKKSTTQAVTNTSTTRGARAKKSTTQSLFTSESCLSASKILSCARLRPAPRVVLFFVRGVDLTTPLLINSN